MRSRGTFFPSPTGTAPVFSVKCSHMFRQGPFISARHANGWRTTTKTQVDNLMYGNWNSYALGVAVKHIPIIWLIGIMADFVCTSMKSFYLVSGNLHCFVCVRVYVCRYFSAYMSSKLCAVFASLRVGFHKFQMCPRAIHLVLARVRFFWLKFFGRIEVNYWV